jgi:hypothetical protein
MKNLFTLLLVLLPVTILAQLDLKYCGQFSNVDATISAEVLPIEGEGNTCFYIMYYNEVNTAEDEVGEMFSGSGNCKLTANKYTVDLDDSGQKLFVEFKENVPMKVNIYDGNKLIASLQKQLSYDELMEKYSLEEALMNEEIEGNEEFEDEYAEESDEDVLAPSVYTNEKGWALSMLMYSPTEGYFAAVSISEGGNCDLNSLEGVLKPGNEAGLYIAELDGCIFAEIRLKGSTAVLTEKKCKAVDRGNCPSLSGSYKVSED